MYNTDKKIGKFSSDDIFLLKIIGACTLAGAVCWIGFL